MGDMILLPLIVFRALLKVIVPSASQSPAMYANSSLVVISSTVSIYAEDVNG